MALEIISAVYGYGDRFADVTAVCQTLVADGNDDITVSDALASDVGVPDLPKIFCIVYTINGGRYVRCAYEGDTIDLVPAPVPPPLPELPTLAPAAGVPTIEFAAWGSTGGGMDVTAIFQALTNVGVTSVMASNETFGGIDPALYEQKTLMVRFDDYGTKYLLSMSEGYALAILGESATSPT